MTLLRCSGGNWVSPVIKSLFVPISARAICTEPVDAFWQSHVHLSACCEWWGRTPPTETPWQHLQPSPPPPPARVCSSKYYSVDFQYKNLTEHTKGWNLFLVRRANQLNSLVCMFVRLPMLFMPNTSQSAAPFVIIMCVLKALQRTRSDAEAQRILKRWKEYRQVRGLNELVLSNKRGDLLSERCFITT